MDAGTFDNETAPRLVRLRTVVSGGQTGVDRAALVAALEAGLATGGWCPRGRRAEDGRISDRFPLRETPSSGYEQRTSWNVRDSDATLILSGGAAVGGTAFTIEEAERLGRPCLTVMPDAERIARVERWLAREGIATLNVGGPRESTEPGVYERAYRFLLDLFDRQRSP
jgi:hypothetical protein